MYNRLVRGREDCKQKLNGKRALGRPGIGWKNNSEMDVMEIKCEDRGCNCPVASFGIGGVEILRSAVIVLVSR
jgi:hypothetical protein